VYKKLVAEILGAEKSGHLSEMITYAEAQNLPYFQACLKEAMRMRPAVGVNMQRFVPPGGAQIDGQFFPEGTLVSLNGWVLHRNQPTFGKDADIFRPERWLEGNAKEMERSMYQASDTTPFPALVYLMLIYARAQFGGGSHLCIGRNLALLEMNKLLLQLLRRYDLQLVHPGRSLQHNTTFFVVQKGLEVFVQRR
jgi:cytochrome P450